MEMIVTRLKPMVSCHDISRDRYNVVVHGFVLYLCTSILQKEMTKDILVCFRLQIVTVYCHSLSCSHLSSNGQLHLAVCIKTLFKLFLNLFETT